MCFRFMIRYSKLSTRFTLQASSAGGWRPVSLSSAMANGKSKASSSTGSTKKECLASTSSTNSPSLPNSKSRRRASPLKNKKLCWFGTWVSSSWSCCWGGEQSLAMETVATGRAITTWSRGSWQNFNRFHNRCGKQSDRCCDTTEDRECCWSTYSKIVCWVLKCLPISWWQNRRKKAIMRQSNSSKLKILRRQIKNQN